MAEKKDPAKRSLRGIRVRDMTIKEVVSLVKPGDTYGKFVARAYIADQRKRQTTRKGEDEGK